MEFLGLDLEFMVEIVPEMLQAMVVTIQISFLAMVIGLIVGLIAGSIRVIGPRPVQILIQWGVNYIRGIPPLIQIFIIYFVLPYTGVILDEFWTGVVALSVIAAGYEVEIVRAAIESISRGQREAALAIGMTESMTLRVILVPQAIRRMIPPLTSELAHVVKSSALLSVIATREITKVGNAIIANSFAVVEVLVEVAILYLVIVVVITQISAYLENKVFAFGGTVDFSDVR
jgi:His/Glu/Gln/Arg/opine family amino acid ABC transporter permease subunit